MMLSVLAVGRGQAAFDDYASAGAEEASRDCCGKKLPTAANEGQLNEMSSNSTPSWPLRGSAAVCIKR